MKKPAQIIFYPDDFAIKKVHKASRGWAVPSPTRPVINKKKTEHIIEKDFYWLSVLDPVTIEITFKYGISAHPTFANTSSTMVAFFKDDKLMIRPSLYGEKDIKIETLPKCLVSEIERIFHARSMY